MVGWASSPSPVQDGQLAASVGESRLISIFIDCVSQREPLADTALGRHVRFGIPINNRVVCPDGAPCLSALGAFGAFFFPGMNPRAMISAVPSALYSRHDISPENTFAPSCLYGSMSPSGSGRPARTVCRDGLAGTGSGLCGTFARDVLNVDGILIAHLPVPRFNNSTTPF